MNDLVLLEGCFCFGLLCIALNINGMYLINPWSKNSLVISMLAMRIFQAIIETNIPRFAGVVESVVVLRKLIYLREIVVCQVALKSSVVLRDPLLVAAFRDNAGATVYAPCQSYLRRRTVALLSYGVDDFVLEQLWRLAWSVSRVRAGERRIASHVNAVRTVPGKPVSLLQVRVQFHLVDSRRVAGVVQESLELCGRKVRDSDVAGLALEDQLGHGGPGVKVLDFVTEGCVGDRPVHVVKVEVVELEVFEGGVDAFFDVLGAVAVKWLVATMRCWSGKSLLVVPELAGDPEIFSLQSCLGQTIGNAYAN
jgi:hypothetical protein